SKLMTMPIKENVTTNGYAFIREYYPETHMASVAQALGQPLVPWEGGLIQDLLPRNAAMPNTYSGIYGLNPFPFHTDLAHWRLPPRYLLLRCVTGHVDVPTLLLDSQTIFDASTPNL